MAESSSRRIQPQGRYEPQTDNSPPPHKILLGTRVLEKGAAGTRCTRKAHSRTANKRCLQGSTAMGRGIVVLTGTPEIITSEAWVLLPVVFRRVNFKVELGYMSAADVRTFFVVFCCLFFAVFCFLPCLPLTDYPSALTYTRWDKLLHRHYCTIETCDSVRFSATEKGVFGDAEQECLR